MTFKLKLKINSVPGYSGTIDVQTDKLGVPLNFFWRKRLKDSRFDSCVEIVGDEPKKARLKKKVKQRRK